MASVFMILTDVGIAEIAVAVAGSTSVSVNQMSVGTGGGSSTTPSASQTALVSEVWKDNLNRVLIDPIDATQVFFEINIPKDHSAGWLSAPAVDFFIREVGLWSSSGALFAVGNFYDSEKPQITGGSGVDVYIQCVIQHANASSIAVSVDPSTVMATQAYVDAQVTEYTYYVDPLAIDQGVDGNDNSIKDLLNTIGATVAAIVLKTTGTYTVTTNLTIPSNVTLIIYPSAILSDGGGAANLIINSKFESDLGQVFDWTGSGEVTFGVGLVYEVYPEWWGANTTPGTTDMTAEIQAAIEATKGPPTTGKVKLSYYSYAITSLTLYEGTILEGSKWMFNGNRAFANSGWTDGTLNFGTFLISTDNSVNAIEFDLTASFTKPQIYDLAIVGPGTGSSIGVNAGDIDINNAHSFLNNVLIGNFSTGLKMNDFVTGSMYTLVLKGCELGWDLAPDSTCTDTKIYDVDIQQCTTGINHGDAGGFNFYGGLIQGNTTGIKFFKAQNCGWYGIHFEGNTADFDSDVSLSTVTLSKSIFHNCKTGTSTTWTLNATEQVSRNQFVNSHFGGLSIDISAATAFVDNSFIGGEIGTLTGLGNVNKSQGIWFQGCKSNPQANPLHASADQLNNLGTISANPTPNWLDGNVVELTFDDDIEIQVPTSMPEGATITFVITSGDGTKTCDFHATYNAQWSNIGATSDVNTVTFKQISKQFYQVGAEKGWNTLSSYTQTYSTADRTVAIPTAAAVGALGNGANGASSVANFNKIAVAIDALIDDNLDLRKTVTALIDDLQARGIVS